MPRLLEMRAEEFLNCFIPCSTRSFIASGLKTVCLMSSSTFWYQVSPSVIVFVDSS